MHNISTNRRFYVLAAGVVHHALSSAVGVTIFSALAAGLLPASYRGASFAVAAQETAGGRRIALHLYPGKDQPYPEDMGRAPRTFRLRGFIVDGDVVFAGGPIQLQRAQLLAALEKQGAGILVHPTLGVLNVVVNRFSLGEDLGGARMSNVEIEFGEGGKRQFPSLLSQSSGILSASNLVIAGLALDGVRAVALAAAAGGQRRDLSITAATWSTQTLALGADATALHRLAAQLPGSYGRFAGGGNDGIRGARATTLTTSTTIADLVSVTSAARVAIRSASTNLAAAVGSLSLSYATGLPIAASSLVSALLAACADPTDAIRLLIDLALFVPSRPEALTPIGSSFCAIMRRAAASALVTAAGQYQPSSADDAASMIARIGDVLEMLAVEAADANDDASFNALRAARAAIVRDLRARGGTLAQLMTVRQAAPSSSLRLAQRYYRDPTRSAQLETQAMPVHPLFMPTTFKALAS